MAKTRMKTTPTRMQKDALLAAATNTTLNLTMPASSTSASGAVTGDTVKKRLLCLPSIQAAKLRTQIATGTSIISETLRRDVSMSSAASSVYHVSETQSLHSSDNEATSSPLHFESSQIAGICKQGKNKSAISNFNNVADMNSNPLKNRKVFLITEKSNDNTCNEESTKGLPLNRNGQKRKMYLIMEDQLQSDTYQQKKTYCVEDGIASVAPKKLTLFADKSDGDLTQKFEKILPEILNRIQAKDVVAIRPTTPAPPLLISDGAATTITSKQQNEENLNKFKNQNSFIGINEKVPITLPPKKNRTKIINTHLAATNNAINTPAYETSNNNNIQKNHKGIIYNNNNINQQLYDHKNDNHNDIPQHPIQTCAATPVIVSPASILSSCKIQNSIHVQQEAASAAMLQKNINLSTDFLFLMKMLPKLESIPEPQKNHVKCCIEKMVMQHSSVFNEQP